jgi:hypothetical protein
MFHDLDETLNQILDDRAAPKELREAEVSFLTPHGTYEPQGATVNLFLYEVKENLVLRDVQPIVTQRNGVYQRRRPPLRVDCTYMASAWVAKPPADEATVKLEHQLLGQAFAWLSCFPTIPDRYLKGGLTTQPYPPPTIVAQMDGDRRSAEFWSALGIPPRPTFSLVVTIALELEIAAVEAGPPVIAIEGLYGAPGEPETLRHIGGRVLDDKGKPVVGALVELLEAGLQARTDSSGRYLLPHPADGSYTLRVTAVGFTPAAQTLVVPGWPEAYEVRLTPLRKS